MVRNMSTRWTRYPIPPPPPANVVPLNRVPPSMGKIDLVFEGKLRLRILKDEREYRRDDAKMTLSTGVLLCIFALNLYYYIPKCGKLGTVKIA